MPLNWLAFYTDSTHCEERKLLSLNTIQAGTPGDAAHPDIEFTADQFRRTLGNFCSGITVLTALANDRPVGMTCQSFFSVSLEPPLVAAAVGKSSTSFPQIREAGSFCVNILSGNQAWVSNSFARSGGDKWRNVMWRPSRVAGHPMVMGSLAWLECSITDVHDAGDHLLVVARVLDLQCNPFAQPLLYFRGAYVGVQPATEIGVGEPAVSEWATPVVTRRLSVVEYDAAPLNEQELEEQA